MPALIPQVMGGVDTYSVSPALPAGLQINAADGVISGIPGALSARQSYVITARNSFGSTTFGLQLEVREAAPQGLLYASPVNATVGMAISPLNPTSLGGMATSYTVSPALPAGLMLNTTSGVISGTPTAVTAARAYTITASNSGG
jgi:hypothetical protein